MKPLLQVKDLSIEFATENSVIPAVKHLNFSLQKGEILAIVGESGSGKSVTALSILKLLPSGSARYSSGSILFSEDGIQETAILRQTEAGMQRIRGNKIGIIFQEPMTSLNPVHTCGRQVLEVLKLHRGLKTEEAKKETLAWFEKVKLPDPLTIYDRYPHQLSGGQKQRVMIAMALCCNPALLICDEPTTALDVTVQKTVLQLIRSLQKNTGMGVIFITHDLGVVAEIADRALVMYKSELLESGSVQDIFLHPGHPYTRGLLSCRPILHKKGQRLPMVSDFLEPGPPHRQGLFKKHACRFKEQANPGGHRACDPGRIFAGMVPRPKILFRQTTQLAESG